MPDQSNAPELVSPQILSGLIGSIYDCALDSDLWDRTLADITALLGGQTAVLGLADSRQGRLIISKSVGFEPEWFQVVESHGPEINAILKEAMATRRSLDDPWSVSRDLSPAFAAASPYLRDCRRIAHLTDILQVFLLDTPRRVSGVGFGRQEEAGPFTDRELALARLFAPHLRRAVVIGDALDMQKIEHRELEKAFDALRCGVILVDERGAVLRVNRAASKLLDGGYPVGLGAKGVLVPQLPSASRELHDAIGLASLDEVKMGRTGLAVLLGTAPTGPVVAHVLPLNGGAVRQRIDGGAVAAVFISLGEGAEAEAVGFAYGLTQAEVRVLAGLMAGHTLTQTATILDIAPSTARTHLDSIFAKTGVGRQAELMRLAAKFAPPI